MKLRKKKEDSSRDNKIAYDFSIKVYKLFKEVIKTVVLFEDLEKNNQKRDTNLIIIVDDCTINWDQELIAWYREELSKLLTKQKYREKIHINTVTLSTFWEEIREGNPATINLIRYGQTIIDYGGFFEPLKVLLAKGKIHATPEAVYTTLKRAPEHIARAKFNILNGIQSLYWSMVDSAHAALMAEREIPPSPEKIPEMLTAVFVSSNKLDKKYVNWFHDLHDLATQITHGKRISVDPKEYVEHEKRAEEFLKKMFRITDDLLKKEKIIRVVKR